VEPWQDPNGGHSQADVLRAAAHSPSMVVRSGHKVGKSMSAAVLALWAFVCFPGARVVLTAPTGRQISEVLWREVTRLYRGARIPIGGQIFKTYAKGLRGPGGKQIIGIAATNNEAFSGVSGAHVFYIVDEASGLREEIFEAIEGNRAAGAWLWMFGNPTRTAGTFFDAFHRNAASYTRFHISSRNTPNARAGRRVVPGLATLEWADERKRVWPLAVYQIRVLGDFPGQGPKAITALSAVEQSNAAWSRALLSDYMNQPLTCGLDVARYGDDLSALAMRRGRFVYPVITCGGRSTVEVAGWAAQHIRAALRPGETRIPGTVKPRVNVDAIGLGAGVADLLDSQHSWMDVRDVNVAVNADDALMFSNLRTQLLFGVNEFLNDGGLLPEDVDLQSEILASEYTFDAQGRIKAEPKEHVKQRTGKSPDRADALALACYEGGGVAVVATRANL
jgi:phage terminase large subunit